MPKPKAKNTVPPGTVFVGTYMEPEVRQVWKAMSKVTGRPMYKLVADALVVYLCQLSADDQKAVLSSVAADGIGAALDRIEATLPGLSPEPVEAEEGRKSVA